MKFQLFCVPRNCKLVFQFPDKLTLSYDLHFGRLRDCWKFLTKEYNSEKVLPNTFGLHHAFCIPNHEPIT